MFTTAFSATTGLVTDVHAYNPTRCVNCGGLVASADTSEQTAPPPGRVSLSVHTVQQFDDANVVAHNAINTGTPLHGVNDRGARKSTLTNCIKRVDCTRH